MDVELIYLCMVTNEVYCINYKACMDLHLLMCGC